MWHVEGEGNGDSINSVEGGGVAVKAMNVVSGNRDSREWQEGVVVGRWKCVVVWQMGCGVLCAGRVWRTVERVARGAHQQCCQTVNRVVFSSKT